MQHALKLQNRRLHHKKKTAQKRRNESGLSKAEKGKHRKLESLKRLYTIVQAPQVFSFISNTVECIRFIANIHKLYRKKKSVFIELSSVDEITYDAIVLLISIMSKFRSEKIRFNGNFPENEESRNLLIRSGFLQNLYNDNPSKDRFYVTNKVDSGIYTHAWKSVDSELGAKLIREASQTVWGEERRCQGIQRNFIELMMNTNNHANPKQTGAKHWWLSVNHVPEEKKVCFSFIDYGVGVFSSLEGKNKGIRTKFKNWKEKLKEKHMYSNNAELMKLILEGTLHKTVTKKHYRGKGLPGIMEVARRNQVSNLHIITNDVHADLSKSEYSILGENLHGTFVYWELCQSNWSCYG